MEHNEPTLYLNPTELTTLYLNKDFDTLSKQFLDILSYFENTTLNELNYETQNFINSFVDIFLYLFIKPDYILPEDIAIKFIKFNPLISNLVAISCFQNTDFQLELLSSYENNFFKILTLYSARNNFKIEPTLLFKVEPFYSSLWYFYYFILGSFYTEKMESNIINHINYLNENLQFIPFNIDSAYYICNFYSNKENTFKLKQKINSLVKHIFKDINIISNPISKHIGIVTKRYIVDNPVYRNTYGFIKELTKDYKLTLLSLDEQGINLDTSIFYDVKNLIIDNKIDFSKINNNNFELIYFTDIGRDINTIYLSNIRMAPIQITGYGYPISTYGSEIDYFIGSKDIEDLNSNYSEKLLLLPNLALDLYYPSNLKLNSNKRSLNKFIINCPWKFEKFNYNMLILLKKLLKKVKENILIRIFLYPEVYLFNRYLPFINYIKEFLGEENIEFINYHFYNDYLNILNQGHLTLTSYPYSGFNLVIDALIIKQPIIYYKGNDTPNKLGAALLDKFNLSELIVSNNNEYLNKLLNLINDKNYYKTIENKIKFLNIKNKFLELSQPFYFKKAIDYLINNHKNLKSNDKIIFIE